MSFLPRPLLAVFAAVVLAGAIVFGASVRVAFSTNPPSGAIVAGSSYGPDGREVAFWTDWRERPEIWAVSTVDGALRPIVDGLADPAWSPTGSWIAFESFEAGNSNIWLVRPDGTGLTQLTQSSTNRTRDSQPAWSPDGKQIVFASNRDRSVGFWIINVDGTGLRSVISPDRPRPWGRPSFSPDGTQIVLSELNCSKGGAGYSCAGSHLLIVNTDGTSLRQLTTEGFGDANPSWGARGILFDSNRLGQGIKMIQPDGTGLQVIPNTVASIKPTWAPDGNKFAFFHDFGIHEFNFLNGSFRPLVEIKGFLTPIDIMPGVSSKTISLKETGRIRVAILPAPAGRRPLPAFDPVSHLSRTFLTFGRTGDERSLDSCSVEGANVVCQFKTALAGFQPGDTRGILRARKVNRTPDGKEFSVPVEGRGTLQVAP